MIFQAESMEMKRYCAGNGAMALFFTHQVTIWLYGDFRETGSRKTLNK